MGGGPELSETAAEEVAVLLSGVNREQSCWEVNAGAVGEPVGHWLAEGDGQFAAGTLDAGQKLAPGTSIPCRQGKRIQHLQILPYLLLKGRLGCVAAGACVVGCVKCRLWTLRRQPGGQDVQQLGGGGREGEVRVRPLAVEFSYNGVDGQLDIFHRITSSQFEKC